MTKEEVWEYWQRELPDVFEIEDCQDAFEWGWAKALEWKERELRGEA